MQRKGIITGALIIALLAFPFPAEAKIKVGGKCVKSGAAITSAGTKYKCTKTSKGLVWQKVVPVVKPTVKPTPKSVVSPKPSASPSETSSPTVAPSPSATPSVTPNATPTPTVSPTPTETPTPTPSAVKAEQTITAPQLKTVDITTVSFAPVFTSTSKLPVALQSSTSNICQVKGSSIALLQTGTCTVVANQAGNDKFLPASSVSLSFEITPPVITEEDIIFSEAKTFVRVAKGGSFTSDTAEISITKVVDDASAKVCASDETAEGCTTINGAGAVDSASTTRYVEFVIHVKNLDSNPLPNISYRLLLKGELSDIEAGIVIETLNDVVVGAKQSADGSLFGLIPKTQKLDGSYLVIDGGITDSTTVLLFEISN